MSLRSSSPVNAAISTAQAAAARQNGYLNQSSYTVRVPGSTGYSSLVSTTTTSGPHHHQQQQHQQPSGPHHQEIVSVKPHSGLQSNVHSEIEQALVHAKQPLDNIRGGERVTAGPYSGIYLNKHEVEKWRGPIPIDQYPIHNDPNPEVIKKRMDKLVYTQELGVRYLNPPPAPKPGDLIIRERPTSLPPAPPLVLRQESDRPHSPPPIIIREAPPRPPARIPEQIIEVEAPAGPPPPRRVVLERFNNLPPKPQDIIVEKWLPYRPQKRRVVFQRAASVQHLIPKNLIIEWEAPDVEVVKQCRDLGVVEADPEEYLRRFGPDLKQTHELPTCEGNTTFTAAYTRRNSMTNLHSPPPLPPQPQFHGSNTNLASGLCYNCQQTQNARGAAVSTVTSTSNTTTINRCPIHYGKAYQFDGPASSNGVHKSNSIPDLEGDIDALRLVDLDKHGLGEYKSIVQQRHQISL